jgi:hypothetical protein
MDCPRCGNPTPHGRTRRAYCSEFCRLNALRAATPKTPAPHNPDSKMARKKGRRALAQQAPDGETPPPPTHDTRPTALSRSGRPIHYLDGATALSRRGHLVRYVTIPTRVADYYSDT